MTVAEVLDDRYEVLERISGGAQGQVFRVLDRQAGRPQILKAVAHADGDPRAVLSEFAHLASVEHEALPRVREVAVIERGGALPAGTVFFTADLVDGVPLVEAVRAAGADELARLIWSVARDVAGALAVLHAAGLLHHDVTPGNILVVGRGADARAVLVDLGLARPAIATGEARGTPRYLAPEALGGAAEPRSDLWSLGAALHHAAAGVPPFAQTELGALVQAILTRDPASVAALPAPLAALVRRLLSRPPGDRPRSAAALARDLDVVAAAIHPPVQARARRPARARRSRRHR